MQLPGSRIAGMNAMERHIFTAVEKHQPGPCRFKLRKFRPKVTVLRVAVHRSLTDNGNILGILGHQQGLIHLPRLTLEGTEVNLPASVHIRGGAGNHGIIRAVRAAQQRGVSGQIQCDMAFQKQRPSQVFSLGEIQSAPLGHAVNRGLKCLRIVRHAVAGGAEVAHIQSAGFCHGAEIESVGNVLAFDAKGVFRIRLQTEQGKNIGLTLENPDIVEIHVEAFRRVIRRVVDQLNTRRGCAGEQ